MISWAFIALLLTSAATFAADTTRPSTTTPLERRIARTDPATFRSLTGNGDAIAVDAEQSKSFSYEGAAPLELMIIGVARDIAAKRALLHQPRPARKQQ